jgi:hypothetical protein
MPGHHERDPDTPWLCESEFHKYYFVTSTIVALARALKIKPTKLLETIS